MIDWVPSTDYDANQDTKPCKEGQWPCIICGRPVNVSNTTSWLHIHGGGSLIVTEEEAEKLNAPDSSERGGDLYMYPVGPDCLRKRPELKPYVQKQELVK